MKRKNNILYIGNSLSKKGNTPSTLEYLASQLKQEGYVLKTASSIQNKPIRLLDMLVTVFNNRKWASAVLIDTYSTLNFQYAVAVATVCRFYHIPYIPILHGGNLPVRLQQSKRQSLKLFGNAMTNVAPSQYLQDAFNREGYKNITYIPNSIKIANYSYFIRKKPQPKLLWVRSFSELYNPMLAVRVVELLIEKGYKNAELCMIGPDKDGSLEVCKAYAKQKNLPVTFTGGLTKEEWIERSKAYDIFINTTNVDNTPVSVIEAMALGLPVVSTNVGGVPFLIDANKDGLLVTPNNAIAFTDQIETILTGTVDSVQLAHQARKKVEQFDWNIVKNKWKAIL
ncbi:glycosyltransferase family 4 protein [Marixanthomonas sp. SCSIO 43207]|uniref:glycosyltransferase family 4 protein n=1 Tax=Marixanthomonas sp. SCSIO 43207 TaxID=2779360 RepID=UPI001CA94B59|nr:glycosyltransferase family 4 protein [Marixanthomonas sp. SCSIO 43207]UAB81207.1 glycosyltransferase family 4 protein [Marixanthomonas sp. SCSIO 43207]